MWLHSHLQAALLKIVYQILRTSAKAKFYSRRVIQLYLGKLHQVVKARSDRKGSKEDIKKKIQNHKEISMRLHSMLKAAQMLSKSLVTLLMCLFKCNLLGREFVLKNLSCFYANDLKVKGEHLFTETLTQSMHILHLSWIHLFLTKRMFSLIVASRKNIYGT